MLWKIHSNTIVGSALPEYICSIGHKKANETKQSKKKKSERKAELKRVFT